MTPEERALSVLRDTGLYWFNLHAAFNLHATIALAIRAAEQEAEERGYKRGVTEERASIIDQLENGPPNGITSIGVVAMIKARAKP